MLAVLVCSLIDDYTSGQLNRGEARDKADWGVLDSFEIASGSLSQFLNLDGNPLTNEIDDRDMYGRFSENGQRRLIDPKDVGKHTFYKSVVDVYE